MAHIPHPSANICVKTNHLCVMPRCAAVPSVTETASRWVRLSFHSLTCHSGTCSVSSCGGTKQLLNHMMTGCSNELCTTACCAPVRKLLQHFVNCSVSRDSVGPNSSHPFISRLMLTSSCLQFILYRFRAAQYAPPLSKICNTNARRNPVP